MRTETDVVFSLIIPSRGRTALLRDCLNSFFEKAKYPQRVEAVVILDYDDPESIAFMTDYGASANRNLLTAIRLRNRHIIKYYHNYGAQCSSGRYVWILNDECLIENQDWDELLLPRIEHFLADKPDRLLYVVVDDDTHARLDRLDTHGTCFPIVSRETVDAQNGIFPQELWMWGADIDLYRIFTGLPEPRILQANDVKVLHRSYHNNTQPVDPTQADVMRCKENCLSAAGLLEYIQRLSRCMARPPAENVAPPPAAASLVCELPRLAEEGYDHFNILWYDGTAYGVRQGTGPFETDQARAAEAGYLTGASVEDVKKQIDILSQALASKLPRLVEEGYRDFNILWYGGMAHGVRQGTGPFETDQAKAAEAGYLTGTSVDDVKRQIDVLSQSAVNNLPRLLEEGYRDFNIVWYDGMAYGVRQSAGPFEKDRAVAQAGYLAGASAEEVKQRIDRLAVAPRRRR